MSPYMSELQTIFSYFIEGAKCVCRITTSKECAICGTIYEMIYVALYVIVLNNHFMIVNILKKKKMPM